MRDGGKKVSDEADMELHSATLEAGESLSLIRASAFLTYPLSSLLPIFLPLRFALFSSLSVIFSLLSFPVSCGYSAPLC